MAIEGFKVEAPGIFSFPALTDEFCELLLQERNGEGGREGGRERGNVRGSGIGIGHWTQWNWKEVQHYRKSGLPSRAPNSMNNYGLVLNETHACKKCLHHGHQVEHVRTC